MTIAVVLSTEYEQRECPAVLVRVGSCCVRAVRLLDVVTRAPTVVVYHPPIIVVQRSVL